ncbi:U32 family peptidase [Clostridiaceae bacterium NSJ-31]|uniref:U32 family peptidase n=1 Tax=Ligaoa zhengdingensis TaxID=2763658 RepID=A0A926DV91_9FIRM|nr:U32 family peptidase [Ligaoa zhengdingensis]MBC8545920.1 U32 family peptidase [Ligaoa zhengdingensis]
MSELMIPEVLAPAGDRERLEAAVLFGADAVYLGGQEFGMRSSPANFTPEQLKSAVEHAHRHGVRVYLTCNTVPTNEEMERLPAYLRDAAACGIDALIVSDIGVLMTAKRVVPELEIHISTQAGVVNYVTAGELHRMGARRIVLARELPLDSIRRIREHLPDEVELECFVHGAMCMSFSGRCLLSNYMVGRDANRGECAQPCRWGYYLMEEKRPGEYYPVYEDERGSYILNAKDLCMIEHIDKLAGVGVNSLKIEGRAKSAYYVAVVTNAYRNAVDQYRRHPDSFRLEPWILEETFKVSHREYSTGFYFGQPENAQCYQDGGYVRTCDVVATVDSWRDGMLEVIQRNRFFPGDQLEALPPRSRPVPFVAERILNEAGETVQSACHPMERLRIPSERPFPVGTILRKQKE